jgi:hypothetical protein
MNPYQSKPNAIHANEQQQSDQLQKWELPFRDLLNQIWWPGYAEQIIQEDPEAYRSEYEAFIRLYDGM